MYSNFSKYKKHLLNRHTKPVWGLDTIKDKNILVAGSLDGSVSLWSLTSHAFVESILPESTVPIYAVTVLENSGHVLTANERGEINVWKNTDDTTPTLIATLSEHEKTVYSLVDLGHGKFVSQSKDRTFKLWDVETLSCISSFDGASDYVSTLVSLPNTTCFICETHLYKIGVWDYRSNIKVNELSGHGNKTHMRALTRAHNDNLLVSGGNDFNIKLWDLRFSRCIKTLSIHENYVNALVSWDKYLASTSGDRSIKIIDVLDFSCQLTLSDAHTSWIQALHYYEHEGTKLLISGSGDHTIGIFDLTNGSADRSQALVFEEPEKSNLLPYISSSELAINYEVKLGEGGFGIVYKGIWRMTDVAIKKLRMGRISEQTLYDFKEEIIKHATLRHPNVVMLFGASIEKNNYCMVMEFMSGGSLFHFLRSSHDISSELKLSIAKNIALGLHYLHEQRVIHRDLKSLNVLLDAHFQAKLADFGLSKIKQEISSTVTHVGLAPGTIRWMAPELFIRKAKCDNRSDIYSLGVVYFELSSRKIPFQDEMHATDELIVNWVKDGERDTIPTSTPRKLATLIGKCWAQRAEERPTTREVLEELSVEDEFMNSGYQLYSK